MTVSAGNWSTRSLLPHTMCDAMMTLSKALSAGQAKKHYDAEYTNARESYYTEDESIDGEWFGKLAKEWGLEGAVENLYFATVDSAIS